MNLGLKGRGLFVFSDPGSAKPVLALAQSLFTKFECLVISDRQYEFFKDFSVQVINYKNGDELKIFEEFSPDYLFTGTSYTSDIELKFVMHAQSHKVISYSFVDHYTNFAARFKFKGNPVFPDKICVLDKLAKSKAILENIVKEKIIITGNPYHDYLRTWAPGISRKEFFGQIGVPLSDKLLLFAPDPLSNAGGKEKFGTDEVEILLQLIDVFKNLQLSFPHLTLGIKLHPNQNKNLILSHIKKEANDKIIHVTDADVNTLLYYSDVVIGIFSNILLESRILGKSVIRILSNIIYPDPFEKLNVGLISSSNDNLFSNLKSLLEK